MSENLSNLELVYQCDPTRQKHFALDAIVRKYKGESELDAKEGGYAMLLRSAEDKTEVGALGVVLIDTLGFVAAFYDILRKKFLSEKELAVFNSPNIGEEEGQFDPEAEIERYVQPAIKAESDEAAAAVAFTKYSIEYITPEPVVIKCKDISGEEYEIKVYEDENVLELEIVS